MRTDKYYSTNIHISNEKLKKLIALGAASNPQKQFNIICKAKSLAEANRIAEKYGLGEKVFERNYTSETGNIELMKQADKASIIICLNGVLGSKYIGIADIFNKK